MRAHTTTASTNPRALHPPRVRSPPHRSRRSSRPPLTGPVAVALALSTGSRCASRRRGVLRAATWRSD
eukprot:8253921-Prorocentrum_lima.AAC.1